MKIVGNIPNENPQLHWGFLNVINKTVLDLGCGKFYSPISTAEWFINQRAKKVIGIDLSDIEYTHPNFKMISKCVSNSSDIIKLIDDYSPEIIKCDIEGAEIYLENIPMYYCVEEIAIEYHDKKTKESCERFLSSWNFNDINYYTLLGEDINRIGVIYSKK